MQKTLYDLLKVSQDAEPEVIAAAFRALSKRYHPDLNKAPDANRVMIEINRAYNTLRDPVTRAEYDRLLENMRLIRPTPKPTPHLRSKETTDSARATQREQRSNADAIHKQEQKVNGLSASSWRALLIIVIIGMVAAGLITQFTNCQQKPEVSRLAPQGIRDDRFIIYNNGTVLDTGTNLMWAARDNGGDINWLSAKAYCDNYRGGGYTNWRMPTQDELAGLFDRGKTYKSACDTDVHLTELIRLSCSHVWASETRVSEAASFYFNEGQWSWQHQSNEYNTRVLPVRSAK